MDDELRSLVIARADSRCEYCRIHQEHDPFYGFPVDHIIAQQHRGPTSSDNLALSCLRCNSHKGPNIASIDPESGELVPLFHPRRDSWADHFTWNGPILVGRTAVGRATVEILANNHADAVLLRQSLIEEGIFPTAG
jgi:5-methylcytosine-specific restriction endonuclease McrA